MRAGSSVKAKQTEGSVGTMEKTIVLCGFMGCGKTAVGRRLSYYTHRRFVDMDEYIENKAGRTVAEIFSQEGEAGFRAREREAVKTLAGSSRQIVSTGGGALTFPENVRAFRAGGCAIVLIDTSLEEIKRRLKNDTKRPLLQRPDRDAAIQSLYRQRLPLYQAAAELVVNGDRHMDAVAHEIMVKTGIFEADHFLGI